jgi:hypothetical protein
MPDFDDWDKDAKGHLKVWPLLGFSTAVFANERGGLRVEVGAPPKPGEPTAAVQIALSIDQLRTLSDALGDVADRLENASKEAGHA